MFDAWIAAPTPLLRYAALHSAARSDLLTAAWIAPAVEAVRRAAVCAAETLGEPVAAPLSASSAARLIAQGAVALLSAVGGLNEENRQAVLRYLTITPFSPVFNSDKRITLKIFGKDNS